MKIQKFPTAPWLFTGIDGFDNMPGNGLTPVRVDLLGNEPGTGKTTTHQRLAVEGALVLKKRGRLLECVIRQLSLSSWGLDVGAESRGSQSFRDIPTRGPAHTKAFTSIVPAAVDGVQFGQAMRCHARSL